MTETKTYTTEQKKALIVQHCDYLTRYHYSGVHYTMANKIAEVFDVSVEDAIDAMKEYFIIVHGIDNIQKVINKIMVQVGL